MRSSVPFEPQFPRYSIRGIVLPAGILRPPSKLRRLRRCRCRSYESALKLCGIG